MEKDEAGFGVKHLFTEVIVHVWSFVGDPVLTLDEMLLLLFPRGEVRNGFDLTSGCLRSEMEQNQRSDWGLMRFVREDILENMHVEGLIKDSWAFFSVAKRGALRKRQDLVCFKWPVATCRALRSGDWTLGWLEAWRPGQWSPGFSHSVSVLF